jgi:hypothetical protein
VGCGQHLPGRVRLPAEAARLLWPAELGTARDGDLFVSAWPDRQVAARSRWLNETEHGHAGACYGPVPTEMGWVTAVDLRPAIAWLLAQR